MKIRIKKIIALARPQAPRRSAQPRAARHVAPHGKNPRTIMPTNAHVRIDSHPLTARASCGFY
jgi:hypothetical protein